MGFKRLIKNIKKLRKIDISHQPEIDYNSIIEILKYELYDEIKNLKVPKVKNIDDSIDDLVKHKASLCRFGDGEIQLLKGKDIPFQKASDQLTKRYQEILSSTDENIFIAFPYIIYANKRNIIPLSRDFWRKNGVDFRNELEKYINLDSQYYAAELTLATSLFEDYDAEGYFNKISELWRGKDVTIVCGETIFDQIEHNIFDCAKTTSYIYAPSQNAFEEYEAILNSCQNISKNHVVIIILGPTAKVLAYDLAKKGYQALDLGHIAKSYDWHLKNKSAKDIASAIEFFNPD